MQTELEELADAYIELQQDLNSAGEMILFYGDQLMDGRDLSILTALYVAVFVVGVFIGGKVATDNFDNKTEYEQTHTHLCKQTKTHAQTNMIVMECIKND